MPSYHDRLLSNSLSYHPYPMVTDIVTHPCVPIYHYRLLSNSLSYHNYPISYSPTPAWHRSADRHILIIKPKWLEKILSGEKDLEIRGAPCCKKVGRTIELAASGTSAVYGEALVVACYGPLTPAEWEAMRARHRVTSRSLPYKRTYAWELAVGAVHVRPKPFIRKNGAIIWQRGG